MATTLKELARDTTHTFSVGGSQLFIEGRWNTKQVDALADLFQELLAEGKIVIAIVGGGALARQWMKREEQRGKIDPRILDLVGILATRENANRLARNFRQKEITVDFYTPRAQLSGGVIYLGSGDQPGHTTDFVAVRAAHETGQTIMLNISNVGGLHPIDKEGELITEEIIEEISWEEYITRFAHHHRPGWNSPLDRPAAIYASENNMTIVLLGPDIENIKKCLHGKPFVGTIIRD